MNINLKKNHVAILMEQSGEVVGVFNSGNDVKSKMEEAVASHFDLVSVSLHDARDFNMPFDYEERYEFIVCEGNSSKGDGVYQDEYITLIMTYSPIY